MISYSLTVDQETEELLRENETMSRRFAENAKTGFKKILTNHENHLKNVHARGGKARDPRQGKGPLSVRSGQLLNALTSKVDGPLTGEFGALGGAAKYAGVVLDKGKTDIHPQNANHLWVPVDKNLTGSGQTRMSPSAFMSLEKAKRAIFRSRLGNLVAVRYTGERYQRNSKRGKKGAKKFEVMFVLKKKITVEGIDAFNKTIEAQERESLDILDQVMDLTLNGGEF